MNLSKRQIYQIIEEVDFPDYSLVFNLPIEEQRFLRDMEDITGKILMPGYNCHEYENMEYCFIPNSYFPKNQRIELDGDVILYLCLSDLNWQDLPESVNNLRYLRKIWLSDNRIMEFGATE